MMDERYVMLTDGVPPEALDGILMELAEIKVYLKNLDKKLVDGLTVLEGAYMAHLEECHTDL